MFRNLINLFINSFRIYSFTYLHISMKVMFLDYIMIPQQGCFNFFFKGKTFGYMTK